MKTRRRFAYIDLAKAVAISLMILCHCGFQNLVTVWIYAFHMPFFFIVSGFLTEGRVNESAFATWLKTKISALLVPYFLFTLIYCFGTKGYADWGYIIYASRKSIQFAQSFTPLWFLPCFFLSSVLYESVKRSSKGNKAILYIAGGGLGLIGWYIGRYKPSMGFPFSMDVAFIGVCLMAVGDVISSAREKSPKILSSSWAIILLFVVGSVLAFVNRPMSLNPKIPHIEMSTGSFGCFPLFILSAAALSYVLIELSRLSFNRIRPSKRFLTIGEYSLPVLCIHGTLITIARVLIDLSPFTINPTTGAVIMTIFVILTSFVIIRTIVPLAPNIFGLKEKSE